MHTSGVLSSRPGNHDSTASPSGSRKRSVGGIAGEAEMVRSTGSPTASPSKRPGLNTRGRSGSLWDSLIQYDFSYQSSKPRK